MSKRIKVNLGSQSYNVIIKNGLIHNCSNLIRSITPSKRFVILSVPSVFKLYGLQLQRNLKKFKAQINNIIIPDGEKNKNVRTLLYILKKMTENGLHRDACLIALGGGVVGDLGGLASSVYMRGIDFIQFPTTLLAQVDASIGGKTAIDYSGIKNLIGTFYQPKAVLIDPLVLRSLNPRQFRTGLAEIIKCGVIKDEKLFRILEKNLNSILNRNLGLLNSIIIRTCQIKAEIVAKDEKENGKRAWLNYGHTLGHALESYFQYQKLNHGEAVAYGMWFASILSLRLGLCKDLVVQRQVKLIRKTGLFIPLPRFDTKQIYEKMFLDKKTRNSRIQFVLTRKIGLVTIQKNIPQQVILSALKHLQAEAGKLN